MQTPLYASLCARLSPITRGDRVEITATETSATWTLDDGRVVRLFLFVAATNNTAFKDAVLKFGEPTGQGKAPYQNAFGATWKNRISVWDRPSFYAVLREDGDPAGDGPYLELETRAEHGREVKAASERPKALD